MRVAWTQSQQRRSPREQRYRRCCLDYTLLKPHTSILPQLNCSSILVYISPHLTESALGNDHKIRKQKSGIEWYIGRPSCSSREAKILAPARSLNIKHLFQMSNRSHVQQNTYPNIYPKGGIIPLQQHCPQSHSPCYSSCPTSTY